MDYQRYISDNQINNKITVLFGCLRLSDTCASLMFPLRHYLELNEICRRSASYYLKGRYYRGMNN